MRLALAFGPRYGNGHATRTRLSDLQKCVRSRPPIPDSRFPIPEADVKNLPL
ncbi:MAG: hypothetical protein F6J90_08940 [Moorea sp. SIOASIH]|uniref:hypothetical protein n=1 Tax=Moorena sp. SIOASIH TaxID=2607817 RepID=UPI0013B69163|nr:hypothetical protein [Moorena sp. SIOASIH]NEO36441.1 hypothetical protein [Moorena sp. SIOASIH]